MGENGQSFANPKNAWKMIAHGPSEIYLLHPKQNHFPFLLHFLAVLPKWKKRRFLFQLGSGQMCRMDNCIHSEIPHRWVTAHSDVLEDVSLILLDSFLVTADYLYGWDLKATCTVLILRQWISKYGWSNVCTIQSMVQTTVRYYHSRITSTVLQKGTTMNGLPRIAFHVKPSPFQEISFVERQWSESWCSLKGRKWTTLVASKLLDFSRCASNNRVSILKSTPEETFLTIFSQSYTQATGNS